MTLEATGAITATGGTQALPTLIQTDTWHTLGTLAGYTINVARYRLTPDNEVELDVDVASAGGNVAVTSFSVTLPAAYRPTVLRHAPLASTRAVTAGDDWPRITLGATGVVGIIQVTTVSATLGTNVRFPLD